MTLLFIEGIADDGYTPTTNDRFESLHSVHTITGDDKHLITLTGIVRIDLKGKSRQEWRTEDITIKPKVVYIPKDQALQIEHWVPFISLNSIYNEATASYAGWGVNKFWCKFRKDRLITWKNPYAPVKAQVLVRDNDGWILRIGYNIVLSGKLMDWVCLPDDPEYTGDEPF